MKTVFTHADSSRVGHAKSILESAGLACFVRNEYSQTNLGISALNLVGPCKLFDPELVVLQDTDYPQALELLQNWTTPATPSADWTCPTCKEPVPGTLAECWSCRTPNPTP